MTVSRTLSTLLLPTLATAYSNAAQPVPVLACTEAL